MASVEELLNSMSDQDYIHDEIQFLIDNDLRTVAIPQNGVVLGVYGDKNVNRINFIMPRYYNGFDMSKFVTRVNYSTSSGTANYYTVNDMIIEEDKILFTWLVDADVTAHVGNVKFIVRMLRIQNGTVLQAFDTTIATANVLEGIVADDYVDADQQEDILYTLKEDLDDYLNTKVLESIPEDYTELSANVNELVNHITENFLLELSNLDFEQGLINTATGEKQDSNYWLRSKRKYVFPMKSGDKFGTYITETGLVLYMLFYDVNDSYLGANYTGSCEFNTYKVSFLVRQDPINETEITPDDIFECTISNMLSSKDSVLITKLASDSSVLSTDEYEIETAIANFAYDTETGFFIRNNQSRIGYRCSYLYPAKELSIYCTDYTEALYMVCYDKNMNYLGYCHPLNQECYYSTLDTFKMVTPKGTKYVGYNVNTTEIINCKVWRINTKDLNVSINPDHNNLLNHAAYVANSKVCIGDHIVDAVVDGYCNCVALSDLGDNKYICINYQLASSIVFVDFEGACSPASLINYTTGNYMVEIPENTAAVFINVPQFKNGTPKYNWKGIMRFYLWKELKPIYCLGDSITWLDSRSGYGEHGFIFGYESHLRLNGYQSYNFGYNGMPYGTPSGSDIGIAERFIEGETDVTTVDTVILAGGLNDVARWYSVTLQRGSAETYDYTTLENWQYKYDNTVDAIISLIVYIKRNAPKARIILCNTIPSLASPYRDFNGLKKFDTIVDEISMLCGVTKCDLMRNTQITENVNNTSMVYDVNTHLNNNGYIAMGNAIVNKVNELSYGTKNFSRWFDLDEAVITD